MWLFIFSITLFSQCFIAYCKAEPNLNLPFPHMVIVGGTGVGKSSLAMALIGEDVMCHNCTFPICPDTDSCTKQTSYAVAPWLGDPDNQNFTIVDTPGFSDSDGEEDELLEEMINVLSNEVKSANSIILALDSTEIRFTDAVKKMLGQLEALFGTKMWNNTIIEMTKFSYSADDIVERDYMCEHHPDDCKNETYWYTEINRQLEEKFHIGMELPMVFIDSWSQMDKEVDDPIEEEHFVNETQKLWDFTMTRDAFEFKSIDEVLDENDKLRRDNEELTADNEKLTADNEALTLENENLTEANENLNTNFTNTVTSLNNEIVGLNTQIAALNNDIDHLNFQIDGYFKNSVVRGLYVAIGGNGCNVCQIDFTIYSTEPGTECTVNNVDSPGNDWQKNTNYYYWAGFIGNCDGFTATGGVTRMKIRHHKKGGVTINFVRVFTDAGSFHCHEDGKEFIDNDDSVTITCVRGA